jgi:hypothetical protein
MIHFVTHVSTDLELTQLVCLRQSLTEHFPAALLHVFNQTLQPVEGSIVCENIKQCGFGWTVRFLRHVLNVMGPDDLVIKVDPDISFFGNPVTGLDIPQGHVFGQRKVEGDCCAMIFYGGFQGYTHDAAKLVVEHGHIFENEVGPQDIAAQKLINIFEIPFLAVPGVELWDPNAEPAADILVWHRARGEQSRDCN